MRKTNIHIMGHNHPGAEDPTPSADLCRYQTHVQTDRHAAKTSIHANAIMNLKKQLTVLFVGK